MSKKAFIISLFIGIGFDILFWKKTPGISFSIFVLLCISAGYLLLCEKKVAFDKRNNTLLTLILVFSFLTFFRLEPVTVLLNYLLTLINLSIFTITYQNSRWLKYSLIDYIVNLIRLLGKTLSFPWLRTYKARTDKNPQPQLKRKSMVWSIFRGLLLSIPILLILGSLLSEADLIFSDAINNILSYINLKNLPEIILRGILIFLAANCFLGALSYTEKHSNEKKLIGREKPFISRFLGSTESLIILGSVLILFIVFVTIQFRYFFFGHVNISAAGYTYSEYARRGFGELVAVSVVSLFLILCLGIVTKKESAKEITVFSGLVIGIVSTLIIILVSAFQRLNLYEQAYGFSRLRTYAHVFMIWLGILLIATMVMEILHKNWIFANAAIITLIGFTLTLNLLNVDAFIVRQNISLAIQGDSLDTDYLSTLSADAVPALVDAYKDSSTGIQEDLLDTLEYFNDLYSKENLKALPWQSFHLSKWYANQKIEGLYLK